MEKQVSFVSWKLTALTVAVSVIVDFFFIVTFMSVHIVLVKTVSFPQVGSAQEAVFQLTVFILLTVHSKGTFSLQVC